MYLHVCPSKPFFLRTATISRKSNFRNSFKNELEVEMEALFGDLSTKNAPVETGLALTRIN